MVESVNAVALHDVAVKSFSHVYHKHPRVGLSCHESQPENPFGNVVFISSDNKKLHVGEPEHVLAHLKIAENLTEFRQASFEIYDSSGRLLEVAESEDGEVELQLVDALQDEADEKEQQVVWGSRTRLYVLTCGFRRRIRGCPRRFGRSRSMINCVTRGFEVRT